jgi:hypothetical protein
VPCVFGGSWRDSSWGDDGAPAVLVAYDRPGELPRHRNAFGSERGDGGTHAANRPPAAESRDRNRGNCPRARRCVTQGRATNATASFILCAPSDRSYRAWRPRAPRSAYRFADEEELARVEIEPARAASQREGRSTADSHSSVDDVEAASAFRALHHINVEAQGRENQGGPFNSIHV